MQRRFRQRLKACARCFAGYHHFDPTSARAIFQDAARQRAPIAVFEITSETGGPFWEYA